MRPILQFFVPVLSNQVSVLLDMLCKLTTVEHGGRQKSIILPTILKLIDTGGTSF